MADSSLHFVLGISVLPFHVGQFHIVSQRLHNLHKCLVQNLIAAVDNPTDIRSRGAYLFCNFRLRLILFDTFDFDINFYVISEHRILLIIWFICLTNQITQCIIRSGIFPDPKKKKRLTSVKVKRHLSLILYLHFAPNERISVSNQIKMLEGIHDCLFLLRWQTGTLPSPDPEL